MGITAHWIEADPNTCLWKLHSEVIAFRGILGAHSGLNLAWSFIDLCDLARIVTDHTTKVCHVILLRSQLC